MRRTPPRRAPGTCARCAAFCCRSLPGLLLALRGAGPRGRGRLLADVLLAVLVVEVPPLVGRSLRIALGRVLPLLLAAERGHIQVAPGTAHRLVAAVVDEVGTEDLLVVAVEGVGAVPFVHA